MPESSYLPGEGWLAAHLADKNATLALGGGRFTPDHKISCQIWLSIDLSHKRGVNVEFHHRESADRSIGVICDFISVSQTKLTKRLNEHFINF